MRTKLRWWPGRHILAVVTVLSVCSAGGIPDSERLSLNRAVATDMCFGTGLDKTSDDPERARELMAGTLRLGTHRPVSLAADPAWTENPFHDANWQAFYHKLTWVDVLRRESLRTGNQEMLERWEFLLRDWIADNPPEASSAPYGWTEVPTAQRAVILSCVAGRIGLPDWLRAAIITHGRMLADPNRYLGVGNHAMYQNDGLLALGCATGHTDWTNLAHHRNEELLAQSIDEQGVTDEGSVAYQKNNHTWWNDAAKRVKKCGQPAWEHADRLGRMHELLTHAAQPDGHSTMIGDTFFHPSQGIPGTPSEYAATQGQSGPMPAELLEVFDQGYAFGRSGWGTQRPFEQETHWSLRFGAPMAQQVHGHEDQGSITFVSHGNQLLWDQGLYAFSGGPMRTYVRSAAAHNGVTVEGSAYDPKATADIIAEEHTSSHDLISVDIRALQDVRWIRTLFYSKRGRYLIVDDRVRPIDSGTSPMAVQRFHLGSDRRVNTDTSAVTTTGPGTDIALHWIGPEPELDVVRGQQEPLLGWRSKEYRQAQPAPVVESRVRDREPRFTTVVVPLPNEARPDHATVTNTTRNRNKSTLTVTAGRITERVSLTVDHATVRKDQGDT